MPHEAERFEANIARCPMSGCWLWAAGISSRGYGEIYAWGRHYSTHRFSWEIHYGPIPAGLHVLHRCDVPCCCNPTHLFLGTDADNKRDMITKGRHATGDRNGSRTKPHRQPRGERQGLAKLTTEQVISIKEDTRTLKAIARDYGVHLSTIHNIRSGKTWTHLLPNPTRTGHEHAQNS